MQGLRLDTRDTIEHRENLRVLSGATDDLYDRYELYAHNAELAGGSTIGTAGPAGSVVPAIIFPNAATTTARWVFGIRPRHGRHDLRLTFYYTSPVGSTNNFSLNWQIDAHYPSGILSTKTTVGAPGAVNYPGPGTADHLVSATVLFQTAAYSAAAHLFLKVGLSRVDPDGNANDMAFVYGLLEVLAA